jgi:hypothetical protein
MMTPLENALADATTRIGVFLRREKPALDPLFTALGQVAPFLPATEPTDREKAALAEYRKTLSELQLALDRMVGRLWSERTALQEQSSRLKVLRSYTNPA